LGRRGIRKESKEIIMHFKTSLLWGVLVLGLVGAVVGCGKPAGTDKGASGGPGQVPANTTDSK
jgi:hypothetical protein